MKEADRTARGEFNEAMRRRIREIAPSLDLSDGEVERALTLEQYEIAQLIKKYKPIAASEEEVEDFACWLFTGRGRPFGQANNLN